MKFSSAGVTVDRHNDTSYENMRDRDDIEKRYNVVSTHRSKSSLHYKVSKVL